MAGLTAAGLGAQVPPPWKARARLVNVALVMLGGAAFAAFLAVKAILPPKPCRLEDSTPECQRVVSDALRSAPSPDAALTYFRTLPAEDLLTQERQHLLARAHRHAASCGESPCTESAELVASEPILLRHLFQEGPTHLMQPPPLVVSSEEGAVQYGDLAMQVSPAVTRAWAQQQPAQSNDPVLVDALREDWQREVYKAASVWRAHQYRDHLEERWLGETVTAMDTLEWVRTWLFRLSLSAIFSGSLLGLFRRLWPNLAVRVSHHGLRIGKRLYEWHEVVGAEVHAWRGGGVLLPPRPRHARVPRGRAAAGEGHPPRRRAWPAAPGASRPARSGGHDGPSGNGHRTVTLARPDRGLCGLRCARS